MPENRFGVYCRQNLRKETHKYKSGPPSGGEGARSFYGSEYRVPMNTRWIFKSRVNLSDPAHGRGHSYSLPTATDAKAYSTAEAGPRRKALRKGRGNDITLPVCPGLGADPLPVRIEVPPVIFPPGFLVRDFGGQTVHIMLLLAS